MKLLLPLLCSSLLAAPKVETKFEQVGPVPAGGQLTRSPNQIRAVVLIHGFIAHLRDSSVPRPVFRAWQQPASLLVNALQKDSDVFSFAYGQNASVDDIARQDGLRDMLANLKKLGYREIVLM